jgi:hypothetical protein
MPSSLGSAATVRRPDLTLQVVPTPIAGRSLRYDILGLAVHVRSDLDEALELVDATYAAFRVADAPADPSAPRPLTFDLVDPGLGGPCLLQTPDGRTRHLADPAAGAIALLEAIVGTVVAGLHRHGLYAVHAGAVVGPAGAVLVAGRSGQGKSTIVLGLVRRGFELLSDELALLDRDGLVHPYPRAVHVRPATVGLIPELAPLETRPRHELGGGSEWSIGPDEVARLLGSRVGTAAPLAGVVLLDGTPDATGLPRIRDEYPAVAALELLRSTWATSADFAGTLETVAGSLAGVPCLRLAVGRFDATIEALTDRLAADRG